jgi:hypothetical protein
MAWANLTPLNVLLWKFMLFSDSPPAFTSSSDPHASSIRIPGSVMQPSALLHHLPLFSFSYLFPSFCYEIWFGGTGLEEVEREAACQ